jgi:HAD superfamily hydrolase (TIGR01484 family)
MYKAVFIDMDGTLLSSDHSISHLNKNAIEELLSLGILVVPISARPLHGILPLIKDLVPDNMPVVSLNGGYIFHNNEIIFQETIPLTEVVAIHNDLQQLDLSVMYYSQMEWFASANSKEIKKEQEITSVEIIIQPFEQTIVEWEAKELVLIKY